MHDRIQLYEFDVMRHRIYKQDYLVGILKGIRPVFVILFRDVFWGGVKINCFCYLFS